MANYQNLKAAISAAIRTNGNQEITGQVLQDVLNSIVSVIGANYTFAGVATPATNPGTPDQNVFYIATQGGTYTNFGATALPEGISLLMWNGSWTAKTIMYNDGGVFDISVYKSTGGTLAKFADLGAALGTNGANIPAAARKGGMSVKFVQSSDNKYVEFRYMGTAVTGNPNPFLNTTNWQGVDDKPTAGSKSLVESGGCFSLNLKNTLIPQTIQFTENNLSNGFYDDRRNFVESMDSRCFLMNIRENNVTKIIATNTNAPFLYIKEFDENNSLIRRRGIDSGTDFTFTPKELTNVVTCAFMWVHTITDGFNYTAYLDVNTENTDTYNIIQLKQWADCGDLNKAYIAGGFSWIDDTNTTTFLRQSETSYTRKAIVVPIYAPVQIVFSGHLKVVGLYKVIGVVNTDLDNLKYKVEIIQTNQYTLSYNAQDDRTTIEFAKEYSPVIFTLGSNDNNDTFTSELISYTYGTPYRDIYHADDKSTITSEYLRSLYYKDLYGGVKGGFISDITLSENNTFKGLVDNSGNVVINTSSRMYAVLGNPRIDIQNSEGKAFFVKYFKINSDGTYTLRWMGGIPAGNLTYQLPSTDRDIAFIIFYNSIDDTVGIDFDFKIHLSVYDITSDRSFYEIVNTLFNNPAANFTNSGYPYTGDTGGMVSVQKTDATPYYRKATLLPMRAGKLVMTGNVTLINFYRVVNIGTGFYQYNVKGSNDCAVEYNSNDNTTTIYLQNDYPAVFTLCNAEDRSRELDTEFVSFEPAELINKDHDYSLPVKYSNPCEYSSTYKSFAEPTMVVLNGVIVISSLCGDENNAYQSVMNSYSNDGGKTWHTNFTNGQRFLCAVTDNNNVHFVLSLDGIYLYKSTDYGMTWNKISNVPYYDHTEVDVELRRLKEEEKAAYEADPTIQRFAFTKYHMGSPNNGIQLANGVICFQRREGIHRYNAVKVDGKWITDSNGYIDTSNSSAYDTSFNSTRLTNSVAYITYSKDFGQTWQSSAATPINVIMDELTIAEAEPNQICINGRGGTEAAWKAEIVKRHIFFQKTPVNDRASFAIDEWVADYETRYTNTIEESIVNAAFCKVGGFKLLDNSEPITFWLFCNIYNPNSFERHSQLLRLSTNCHDWFKVRLVSEQGDLIGGYVALASDDRNIYLVMEDKRVGKPLRFINLTVSCLEDILNVYLSSNALGL